MMKTVLIALDFNPTAQKVAEVGYSLAKTMNAQVKLLHVLVDPFYYTSPDHFPLIGYTGSVIAPLQLKNIDETKVESEKYLEKIKVHLGDSSIETFIKEGDFAEMILSTAQDIKADLIVMGSHSKRWLEEILIGSVTEKVLRNSTIPLFIIPTQKKSV